MLASQTSRPLDSLLADTAYAVEPKLDGIRCLLVYERGVHRLYNRQLTDITNRFPELAFSIAARDAIFDGELVCADPITRLPNFQLMQTRANRLIESEIPAAAARHPASFAPFDLIYANGYDLSQHSWQMRRRYLEELALPFTVPLLKPEQVQEIGEGLVFKLRASLYEPAVRSKTWLKFKWEQSRVVEAYGYMKGQGRRVDTFGALLIRDPDTKAKLGKVGSGFTDEDLETVMRKTTPLLIRVKFNEVTDDGKLRFPRYAGLV